jgi:hypothetical protein
MKTADALEPISDRAQTIFETQIKTRVTEESPDAFLAIDVVSGDYEVAPDDITPGDRLRERHPDAQVFLRRVGDEAAYFIGGLKTPAVEARAYFSSAM